ncbi:MAG: 23S rRNA (adenine(2503)-C(2))-methyltransferase RlmN [Limisphaerales bacterium]
MNRDIKSLTLEELQGELRAWEQPAYRASQVIEWLYSHHAITWDAMTNLPRALRERLPREFSLHPLELVTRQGTDDTTQKFLWRLADGALIESVLIPASPALYGEASDRHTLCVSTQVGCAYGCLFCASGLDGWKRNLGVEEIVEQVLATERWHASRNLAPAIEPAPAPTPEVEAPKPSPEPRSSDRLINNLVVMGMGEPLANYDALLKALRILNAPWGGNLGARKITISTSGLCPQIRRLADEPFQFRLAISLHGATDEVRDRLMPINRKYPLRELLSACQYYQSRKGRMITFEYILIAGLNDHPDQTAPLADLAHRVHAKVNLIPYNRVEGLEWERPYEARQEAFLQALTDRGVTATLRREKGHDIDAACGQLRLKTERALPAVDPGQTLLPLS